MVFNYCRNLLYVRCQTLRISAKKSLGTFDLERVMVDSSLLYQSHINALYYASDWQRGHFSFLKAILRNFKECVKIPVGLGAVAAKKLTDRLRMLLGEKIQRAVIFCTVHMHVWFLWTMLRPIFFGSCKTRKRVEDIHKKSNTYSSYLSIVYNFEDFTTRICSIVGWSEFLVQFEICTWNHPWMKVVAPFWIFIRFRNGI